MEFGNNKHPVLDFYSAPNFVSCIALIFICFLQFVEDEYKRIHDVVTLHNSYINVIKTCIFPTQCIYSIFCDSRNRNILFPLTGLTFI